MARQSPPPAENPDSTGRANPSHGRSPLDRPPSVDTLARALADDHGLVELPQPLRVDAARAGISAAVQAGEPASARRRAIAHAEGIQRAMLGSVINATGVLLHTNLGRAPASTWRTGGSGMAPVRYTNVELDLGTGRRGSRRSHCGPLLARLCGAEAAIVVNNCAAAVMLVLAALGRNRDVIVSRGELVEIGGGFRVPDVMEQSGARLVEVGTTNRTRLSDYERAIAKSADPALVLKVHQSNYRITGFTEDVAISRLSGLSVPVVADIGSGLLDAHTPWLADASGRVPALPWLEGEPAARQSLDAGAALVLFSGDKLFGGPQAGIIAGRADLVDACATHPLYRAFRPGALLLDAVQVTALAYLRGSVGEDVPFWRMAILSNEDLRARADQILRDVDSATPTAAARKVSPRSDADRVALSIVDTEAVPGGGTLPGVTFPSIGIAVEGDRVAAFRNAVPPIIARVDRDRTIVDLRTVDPADDFHIVHALRVLPTSSP